MPKGIIHIEIENKIINRGYKLEKGLTYEEVALLNLELDIAKSIVRRYASRYPDLMSVKG